MIREVLEMVLPVLVMIAIGCMCNKKQIFNAEGLQGIKAVIGNVMLPVTLFYAFLTAAVQHSCARCILCSICRVRRGDCCRFSSAPFRKTIWQILAVFACKRGGGYAWLCALRPAGRQSVRLCSCRSWSDGFCIHCLAWTFDIGGRRKNKSVLTPQKYAVK